MNTTTTQGVTVSVTTNYLPDYSSPGQEHYVFAYKIDIRNNSEYTVKLLRRHWFISDANGVVREVEGEGVVGQQPVLEPGESHQYVSGCNLKSGVGKMSGTYQMERVMDGSEFDVEIPEFTLIVPYRLN
ncbi:Co2+/Mg2+ efflux protein ApaG [Hymenobacter actinosclerus]|uniref:Protein ApaG n=1 Tax=Hymenobacter actinosclerus TaxID=82805 RepID=A0A1I0B2B2_9BACT|nr:Co2+/Mg2+ efflux protein ApaG [Hymenobacter actinosclerus]SET00847.1 ApaG protein [Hymenobacter actinosclerus]